MSLIDGNTERSLATENGTATERSLRVSHQHGDIYESINHQAKRKEARIFYPLALLSTLQLAHI